MKLKLSILLLALTTSLGVNAGTLACPDLATAKQVGACPLEEELQYTFTGYCSDNAKAYKGETDVCTDYRLYRELKNVALWESADTEFSAYVSCGIPAATVNAAKLSSMKIVRKGKMIHLVCGYGDNLSFTYRTRDTCKLEGADCANNPSGCKANCT